MGNYPFVLPVSGPHMSPPISCLRSLPTGFFIWMEEVAYRDGAGSSQLKAASLAFLVSLHGKQM